MSTRSVVLAALAVGVAAQAAAQSLAEVAEREKKRQEALAGKRSKVITGKDLNPERAAWTGWQEFSAPQLDFAVALPSYPSEQNDTEMTDLGVIRRTLFTSESGGTTYAVIVSDYPDRAQGASHEAVFDAIQVALSRSLRARTRVERPVQVGSLHGREFVLDQTRGGAVTGRVFLTRERVFMLMAVEETLGSGETEAFFGSFRLLR